MEAEFLRSHLALSGLCPDMSSVLGWYRELGAMEGFSATPIPLSEVQGWRLTGDPSRLGHETGRFFTLEGIRVQTSHGPVKSWDQPIINQPEVGILGFLTKRFGGVLHFLTQAKREPGNVNQPQLAPTVQATWSNYTRVHKGKNTPYLSFFVNHARARVVLDQLHNEQASRFLCKRNRNVIVETTEDVEVLDGYRWLTLGQLKVLLGLPNVVNMDSRSVLSLIPLASLDARAAPDDFEPWALMDEPGRAFWLSSANTGREMSSMDEIVAWLDNLRLRRSLHISRVPLGGLRHWITDGESIRHDSDGHFSVIGVSVRASCRETHAWSQPILHHAGRGLRGFLTRDVGGVAHFLARASLEPGSLHGMEIGPTISCSDARERRGGRLAPALLDLFLDADGEDVLYRCVHSEEGGRFHHFQNEYMILRSPHGLPHPGPCYRWMTLGQLLRFSRHGKLTMEARNLLACLSVLPGAGRLAPDIHPQPRAANIPAA
jgi:oxidase EvaA